MGKLYAGFILPEIILSIKNFVDYSFKKKMPYL